MLKLELPIETMIDATNRGDSARLLSAFAEDALLTDFGRDFKGKAAIARWNDSENIGTQNNIRVTSVKRTGSQVSVTIAVTGNGYNGPGTLKFHLEGDTIKRLVITG
jgi:ketosteroid isomerase-like protein